MNEVAVSVSLPSHPVPPARACDSSRGGPPGADTEGLFGGRGSVPCGRRRLTSPVPAAATLQTSLSVDPQSRNTHLSRFLCYGNMPRRFGAHRKNLVTLRRHSGVALRATWRRGCAAPELRLAQPGDAGAPLRSCASRNHRPEEFGAAKAALRKGAHSALRY